jgi:YfiH family protein
MLPLLQSDEIGARFAHGFTTRAGGVSAAPYDTLNLGGKWGDEPAHVTENRRRVAEAIGGRPFVARQVHGTVIRRVRAGDDLDAVARQEADGLCTDAPGLVLGVFVADCVPVLLADARTGACAAVHAGWRGTVAGILPAAVRTLASEFGARPSDLRVALGPAIGPCCFEVGLEVVDAPRGARPRHRSAVAARARGPGARRPARRESAAAGTRGRRSGGHRRRRPRRGLHAPRSAAVLFVPPRRCGDRAADGRHSPPRGAGP